MARHHHLDWDCIGQACEEHQRYHVSPCWASRPRRSPLQLVDLFGGREALLPRCRLFAELHNNEWRALLPWSALGALRNHQRQHGCNVSTAVTLREPHEQLVSELLYFNTGGLSSADHSHIAAGIQRLPENLVVKLGFSNKLVRSTPILSPGAVESWARQLCRQLALSVSRVLFVDTLAEDWAALASDHGLSRAPLRRAGRTSARWNASALVQLHTEMLTRHNRLSRALYDLLTSDRQASLAGRCESTISVPDTYMPPPPPSPPPSPPHVCVGKNMSGCHRDEDCCDFVAPLRQRERRKQGRLDHNVFCERMGRGRPMACLQQLA